MVSAMRDGWINDAQLAPIGDNPADDVSQDSDGAPTGESENDLEEELEEEGPDEDEDPYENDDEEESYYEALLKEMANQEPLKEKAQVRFISLLPIPSM